MSSGDRGVFDRESNRYTHTICFRVIGIEILLMLGPHTLRLYKLAVENQFKTDQE